MCVGHLLFCTCVLVVVLSPLVEAANRITALEWVESVVNSPGIAAYKTYLYEVNDYIGPLTEEYVNRLYQTDYHRISMDLICGYSTNNVKSAFEYIDQYLRYGRLYFLPAAYDDVLWEDGAMGRLKKFQIIDLVNEVHALDLFSALVESFTNLVCTSRSCPGSKDKPECIEGYRGISQLLSAWVRFLGTNQADICNGIVSFDSTSFNTSALSEASFALANVYLHKSLLPFVQGRMCMTHQFAEAAWNMSLVSTHDSDFVANVNPLGISGSSNSLPDKHYVVDRAFNYSASYDDCFAIVGKYRSLPAVDEVASCYTFTRDFVCLPSNVQDPLTEIKRLDGGGTFTTALMACITLKSNLSTPYCHIAGDLIHDYILGVFTAAMALSAEEFKDKTRPQKVLNLGLGGGSLHTFQRIFFPYMDVESIEIDRSVVKIYLDYYDGQRFVCAVNEFNNGKSIDSNCRSRVIIADGWQYVQHLAAMLPPPPALHDMYYDLITTDMFTSLTTTWKFESDIDFSGESNVFVETYFQSLPLLRELIRPRAGLLVLHFHMDGRFAELLQAAVQVFGEDQLVYLQTGYDVLLVAARDRFGDQPGQVPHPCSGHLLEFAKHMEEFGRSLGYSRKWQHRFKYSVRCHWQEFVFREE